MASSPPFGEPKKLKKQKRIVNTSPEIKRKTFGQVPRIELLLLLVFLV